MAELLHTADASFLFKEGEIKKLTNKIEDSSMEEVSAHVSQQKKEAKVGPKVFELVKKELLESKQHFNEAWACSKAVKDLAGMIFEKNDNKIFNQLSEALEEVPYFAFVNKRDLHETVKSTLSISESVEIKEEYIKQFVNKLFEMKKPHIQEPQPERLDDEEPWEESDPEMRINNRIQRIKEDVAKLDFAMKQARRARKRQSKHLEQILERQSGGLQKGGSNSGKQASAKTPTKKEARE